MPKILLIEDEEVLRDAFSLILSTLPYEADTAANGSIALGLCEDTTYDLIFLDLMMPVMNGVDFLEEFTKMNAPSKIIIMSNLSSSRMLEQALEYKVHRSILKSDMSPANLVALINEEFASPTIQK
jgi:Response regulator containing CheY-like receiver, AAA-type ATPase, and DNA-binding domains